MLGAAQLDRRTFLRASLVAGVSVMVRPLGGIAQDLSPSKRPTTFPNHTAWKGTAGTARRRIEGWAKVTGAKLYAADMRAADMPGWPRQTAHAMLLKARDATHVFEGIDLSFLDEAWHPDRVVLATDLAAAHVTVPDFYVGDLICPAGATPLYLGQPVALLIWHDFARLAVAKEKIRSATRAVRMGAATSPVDREPYGGARFVRVAGPAPEAEDIYSPVAAGWVFPQGFEHDGRAIWANPARDGSPEAKAAFFGDQIRADMTAGGADLFVLDRTFATQSVDQVFLEPEAGLAWYDPGARRLELVIGVQSPDETASSIATLVSRTTAPRAVTQVVAHCAPVGGGFGGKDHTSFPLYAALAALFSPGRPVRLANDRFDQFQSGIKRHAFKMRSRMAVDRRTGRIGAFAADHELDGGGLANFAASVAYVGGTAAIGIYDVPKVDVQTVARHSRAVTAGSMRGYGTLQTMTALEVLIDEAATSLGQDPVEFRKRNLLRTGAKNMTGNVASGAVRTGEVLDRLGNHRIWKDRAAQKSRRAASSPDKAFGVGLACVNKDFGTGSDGSLALVEIDREGRVVVTSQAVEIGNGIATALAVRVAERIGVAADEVRLGDLYSWTPLGLVTSGNARSITQNEQDAAAKDPRWTPEVATGTAASLSAHVHTHVAAEAADVIWRFGLWPAAKAIWSAGPLGGQAAGEFLRIEDARFVDGRLTAQGMEPLTVPRLAAKAHEMGLVTSAMVHGYNRWSWASATFDLPAGRHEGAIDALAVKYGTGAPAERKALMTAGGLHRLDRVAVAFPPAVLERIGVSYYSACGTVVAIEVDKRTGALRILEAATVLECGRPLVPELVAGQAEGGFAMGVGYALYEDLPLYEDGPGDGTWNLDRYRVPRASDLPIWKLDIDILPPLGPTDAPKGIAEVVMIPVVPALLNAIHDAIGKRFAALPVTRHKIKGALA
jgi:CO/xanthine dehydrogenase Mo-binding subunit